MQTDSWRIILRRSRVVKTCGRDGVSLLDGHARIWPSSLNTDRLVVLVVSIWYITEPYRNDLWVLTDSRNVSNTLYISVSNTWYISAVGVYLLFVSNRTSKQTQTLQVGTKFQSGLIPSVLLIAGTALLCEFNLAAGNPLIWQIFLLNLCETNRGQTLYVYSNAHLARMNGIAVIFYHYCWHRKPA